jgi:hypothetical protein
MKTFSTSSPTRQSQRGSAVLVMLALMGIMLALVAANAVSVHVLDRELQLLDHKQQHRLEHEGTK